MTLFGKKKNDPSHPGGQPGFFNQVQIELLVHDLKGPLAVARAGLQNVLDRRQRFGQLTSRQEKALERALRNVRKTQSLVEHLLEVGRGENGPVHHDEFRPVEVIHACLIDALDIMGGRDLDQPSPDLPPDPDALSRAGVDWFVADAVRDLIVMQDRTKCEHILVNLFKNALHFRRERMGVRIDRRDAGLEVEVLDDGPGVAPEDREKIFERWTQGGAGGPEDRKGHGLGLAGSRILARRLGGDVELDPGLGAGALFRLTLPLKAPEHQSSTERE
jgi:signal transduction histidine kinase